MIQAAPTISDSFARLVSEIPALGMDWHRETLLENSRRNMEFQRIREPTIRDVRPVNGAKVLIVSAGPSLYQRDMLARLKAMRHSLSTYLVAIDGSYVQCLRAGIVPDFVMTLDPHPTRIVRWFGDPDFEANSAGDDYFARQDLDEHFRADAAKRNAENFGLVNAFQYVSLVICSTSPINVVLRTSGMPRYWFAPLVDNPHLKYPMTEVGFSSAKGGFYRETQKSLTREIAEITGLPSLNTGGTVGTAAVMFAHCILKAQDIAVIGMDLGYAADTPHERTQSWNMLKGRKEVADLYPKVQHPQWGECFTDPTYWHYRNALLSLLKSAGRTLYNCTEGGTLYGPHVQCMKLEDWLNGSK